MRGPRLDGVSRVLERVAAGTTRWVGSSWVFLAALLLTAAWLVSGPLCHWSDTWQLVMNTISSVVTFLMVFLLQRSQNKDAVAMQLKLNELLAAHRGASNRLINLEDLSEEEVYDLHRCYQQLAERAEKSRGITASVSIEQVLAPSDLPLREQAAGRLDR
jgi:low affinity Fe/Cu permease